MRIALAGKGGAGKTTISATVSRLLARTGTRVVAIDADTNPNLGPALGAMQGPVDATPYLPTSLVSRRLDGPALACTVDEALAEHATVAPDGVLLVRMGTPQHTGEGCLCSAHATASALLSDLGRAPDTTTVMDLEASPEHLSRGTARHAELLLLVAEPYFRSLETVKRQAALAAELPETRVAVVANKVRDDGDAQAIDEFCDRIDTPCVARIPWSDDVLEADRRTTSLLDHAPDSAVVDAIGGLAESVRAGHVGALATGRR